MKQRSIPYTDIEHLNKTFALLQMILSLTNDFLERFVHKELDQSIQGLDAFPAKHTKYHTC